MRTLCDGGQTLVASFILRAGSGAERPDKLNELVVEVRIPGLSLNFSFSGGGVAI